MKNTFKLTEEGIRLQKSRQKKRIFKICSIMVLPFFIAPLFVKELLSVDYLIALIAIVMIILITSFFIRNIFIDTTIEVFEFGIIRSGRNLSTVKLKYTEIGKIIERSDGIVVFKGETHKKLKYLNDRTALTNRKDVIFIPIGIDNFDKIVQLIKYKTISKLRGTTSRHKAKGAR